MKRICRLLAVWSVLAVIGSFPVLPSLAKEPESLKDDIQDVLRDIAEFANRNGGSIVPDSALELGISRLEHDLPFMDRLLAALPCGKKAPDVLDVKAALDAVRRLIPTVPSQPTEKNIDDLKKRIEFLDKVHITTVNLIKLKVISGMTTALIAAVPASGKPGASGVDFGNVLDQGLSHMGVNPADTGTVKKFPGLPQYRQYLYGENKDEFQRFAQQKVDEGLRKYQGPPGGGPRFTEYDVYLWANEFTRTKSAADKKAAEQQLEQKKKELTVLLPKSQEAEKRKRYFEGLVARLEAAWNASLWVKDKTQFEKPGAVITVSVVDAASGSPIGDAKVGLTPPSGTMSASMSSTKYVGVDQRAYSIVAEHRDYNSSSASVTVTDCKDHPVVVRLVPLPKPPAVATLHVSVMDEATRKAVPNPRVDLTPAAGWKTFLRDPDRMVFEKLPPDSYSVTAEAEGYTSGSDRVTVIEQKDYSVVIWLKKKEEDTGPVPHLTARLDCGGLLEVVPGQGSKACTVIVEGWRSNTVDPVEVVLFPNPPPGGIVMSGNTSVDPGNMYTAGVSDKRDEYPISEYFRADDSAPPGTTPFQIVVRQRGAGSVTLPLSVIVLPKKGGPVGPAPGSPSSPPISSTTGGQLSARLDCGGILQLVPGQVSKSCGVVLQGWRSNTADRVEVEVVYPRLSSGIEVFPGTTSQDPGNMYTAGVSDHQGEYIFSEGFSASDSALPGTTPVRVVVRQRGAGELTLSLNVTVLAKGTPDILGIGTPPPVQAGTGGNICVWRYKLIGDPYPDCWHFVASTCENRRYANKPDYPLAGSNMNWGDADRLIGEQSRYFSDACRGIAPGPSQAAAPPPATVAAGSGGEYCVWRYKLFGDPPACFHFAAAACDTPRYTNPRGGYELVGSGMKRSEADARIQELSRYFDDAYACRAAAATPSTKPATPPPSTPSDSSDSTPPTPPIGPTEPSEPLPPTGPAQPTRYLSAFQVACRPTTIVAKEQSATCQASGVYSDKPDQAVNLTAPPTTWENGPTFSSDVDGEYTVTASLEGLSGSATVRVKKKADIAGATKEAGKVQAQDPGGKAPPTQPDTPGQTQGGYAEPPPGSTPGGGQGGTPGAPGLPLPPGLQPGVVVGGLVSPPGLGPLGGPLPGGPPVGGGGGPYGPSTGGGSPGSKPAKTAGGAPPRTPPVKTPPTTLPPVTPPGPPPPPPTPGSGAQGIDLSGTWQATYNADFLGNLRFTMTLRRVAAGKWEGPLDYDVVDCPEMSFKTQATLQATGVGKVHLTYNSPAKDCPRYVGKIVAGAQQADGTYTNSQITFGASPNTVTYTRK